MSFYVSVRKTDRPEGAPRSRVRSALVFGPFNQHGGALANVDRVRRFCVENFRDAWTYSYGTCRDRINRTPGTLNDQLGYEGPGELP